MTDPLPTGAEIRIARVDRGLTQKELAEKAGLHPLTVCKFERGHQKLSLEALTKIIEALNRTPKATPKELPKLNA